MEIVIGIVFIIFCVAKGLFGKDMEKPKVRLRHFVQRNDEDEGEKYPPSYY